MKLTINGNNNEYEECTLSITQLLSKLELPIDHIAVEVNRSIIPRAHFNDSMLNEGDVIEIVRFVGGGINLKQNIKG